MREEDVTISITNNVIKIDVNPKGSFDKEEDGEQYLVSICSFRSENNGTSYVLEDKNNDELIDDILQRFEHLEIKFVGKIKDVFERREEIIEKFEEYEEKGLETKEKENHKTIIKAFS